MTSDSERIVEVDREDCVVGEAAPEVGLSRRDGSAVELKNVSISTYIVLPLIFLLVTLLGGLRLNSTDNSLVFLKPALVCLVFAAGTLVLVVRAGLISIDGWFNENNPTLRNLANATILLTLFSATVQIYNSLLPEQGLTFWIVGFCFFWTLWNSLFAGFDANRLLRSFGALFGLAFVIKYLVLTNLAAPEGASWFQRMMENPGRETVTWLLDLPRYGSGTGYIQFFTLCFYLIGLYLTPASNKE
jgi:hypothetical protein